MSVDAVPPSCTNTLSCAASDPPPPDRVSVNVAGSLPASAPVGSAELTATVGRKSSSTTTRVTDAGEPRAYPALASIVTVTVSSPSTSASSTGVIWNVALACPAGMA